MINADNLVSQDSNGSSGTGHEDSGPEHRLDRHVDEQPGPSNSIPSGGVATLAATSSTSNVQDNSDNNTPTSAQERTIAPYKLCILKDKVRERDIVEILRDIDARTYLESTEYNRESGIVDRKRTEHDYARSKSKAKMYSMADRSAGVGRSVTSSTNAANRRREERDRLNHARSQNAGSRQTSNGQPRRRYIMRDDDEEEVNANAEDNDEDELDTSDCSLDESDFSSSVRKLKSIVCTKQEPKIVRSFLLPIVISIHYFYTSLRNLQQKFPRNILIGGRVIQTSLILLNTKSS